MSSQAMFKTLPDKVACGVKTATFIGHVALPAGSDATWYVAQQHYKCEKGDDVWYVIVSASDVPYSGPETFIFKANEKGEITDWSEQPGSFKGALDHRRALRNAGYVLDGETPIDKPSIDKKALQASIEAAELQVKMLNEGIARAKLLLSKG